MNTLLEWLLTRDPRRLHLLVTETALIAARAVLPALFRRLDDSRVDYVFGVRPPEQWWPVARKHLSPSDLRTVLSLNNGTQLFCRSAQDLRSLMAMRLGSVVLWAHAKVDLHFLQQRIHPDCREDGPIVRLCDIGGDLESA